MWLQPESITRAIGTAATASLLLTASLLANPVAAQNDDPVGAALRPIRGWKEAPGYVSLFVPRGHDGAYRAFLLPPGLDDVLEALAAEPALVRTPGGWTAREELAVDAFGQAGVYDPWKLARLYGSRRARVARGPRQEGGRVVESWTLVSPYPDPSLSRLLPGTLLMVLRLP